MTACSIQVAVELHADPFRDDEGWIARYEVPAFSKLGYVTDSRYQLVIFDTEEEARSAAYDEVASLYAVPADPPIPTIGL